MSSKQIDNMDCKIYVGNLNYSTTRDDLEDVFLYYGPIRNVWVARNPPGFAFVEFEDKRDAQDAAHKSDGKVIRGHRVRVERARVMPRSRISGYPSLISSDRCFNCDKRGHYARNCPRGPQLRRASYEERGRRRSSRDRRSRSRSSRERRSRSPRERRSRSPRERRSRSSRDRRSRSRSERSRSESRSRSRSTSK
ncbi:serine/arginine-rich splicing factor 7-like [Nilaparvata lugens]|uniref:serine/arginine-rich splicing factor 7-like n=1 Tax=Nilaparvata lugens TaxID=108931 RepID=UPI00193DAF87|nr:serine/arginine-rich splicing factor 7-like [Nilaparvata lugens]XP_039294418.1 serine/arginine-rich splicing factor 7-like [Nilaparvata lugens]